jgi:hypothetical protein
MGSARPNPSKLVFGQTLSAALGGDKIAIYLLCDKVCKLLSAALGGDKIAIYLLCDKVCKLFS